jgi:hypothetical protein
MVNTIVFPFVLPPMVLSVFGAVHNMCLSEPSMATGGTMWFPDLIVVRGAHPLPAPLRFCPVQWPAPLPLQSWSRARMWLALHCIALHCIGVHAAAV